MNIHYTVEQLIKKQAMTGCGNHLCMYKKPKGQGTNGPCSCSNAISSKLIQFIIENKKEFLDQIDYIESK